MPDLAFASIAELSAAIDARRLDPVELTALFLDRAKGVGQPLNAYVHLREREALEEAKRAAERLRAGRRVGPLDGIPLALKDNIDVAGVPTTNGLGGVPPTVAEDAEVTCRLMQAGAVLLGKLNMHEAALGGTTDNPHHGRTHNPFELGRSPGGSSGGSGAAVAAGLCAAALGTDTAGSIRLPAAYCGVVGLKPTINRVDLRGIMPLSRRLDHVGPLTRTCADAALLMRVLADDRYAWSDSRSCTPRDGLTGRTIGVLENYADEAIDPDVAYSFSRALAELERAGAHLVRRTLPAFDPERVRYAIFLLVEAGAALEHGNALDASPERFSRDLARCIKYGRQMSAVQLLAQENVIAPAAAELLALLTEVDAVASPTTPQPAFRFEESGLTNLNTFCTLANFTGCPALSVPMGSGPDGLPHGLQLLGRLGRDEDLLHLANAYEAATGHRPLPPAPFGPHPDSQG